MDEQQAFEKSLPYQFRQLMHELNAVATSGGQGIVVWRGFTAIATLNVSEAATLRPSTIEKLKRAFATKVPSPLPANPTKHRPQSGWY